MGLYFKRKRRAEGDLGEPMNVAERWLSDGVHLCELPAGFLSVDVDMTRCETILSEWKRKDIKGGTPALLVRAAALALAKYPQLHVMRLGYRRVYPKHVDIGLSVAGETFVAPLMVIRQAELKTLEVIAEEIARRVPEVQDQERAMNAMLRRWGWILPFGTLRRSLLRVLFRQSWFRVGGVGTFQVTCLPDVQVCVPYRFSSSAIMAAGGTTPRVIAGPDGPVVKPMLTLACSADHVAWDGMCGSLFLRTVKQVLESGSFNP